MYNSKAEKRAEELGGRTVVQLFISFVEENNYLQLTHHDSDTNEVVDLMFAHPISF